MKNPGISITNPTTALRLIRNFGPILKHLYIQFRFFSVKFCAEIERYLCEYCSQSLKKLSLDCNCLAILFIGMNKPLENITFLGIYVRRNEKLNNVDLLNKYLPRLQHVGIETISSAFCESEKIHFENVEYCTIAPLTLRKYSFSFNKLKHLTIDGSIILNHEWCELVCNIPSLRTLKIMGNCNLDQSALRRMLTSPNFLSNIEELLIGVDRHLLPDDILSFLRQSQRLKRLALLRRNGYMNYNRKSDNYILGEITSNLTTEWKFYVIDPFVNPYHGEHIPKNDCYVIERFNANERLSFYIPIEESL